MLAQLLIPGLDLHDAIAVRERQLGARDYPEHLEGDGAEPDAEGHRQAADDGEPGILHEHTEAQRQVEREAAEPRRAAPVAECLAMLLHPAEGRQRAPPRLVMIEPLLAHEPLGLHL